MTPSERPFSYLVLYSPMIPFFLYLTLDILNWLTKYRLERKYIEGMKFLCGSKKKKDSVKQSNSAVPSYFRINDPNPLSNFGQIEYVFLDKTGTMTKRNYTVSTIYFNNKVYEYQNESRGTTVTASTTSNNLGLSGSENEIPFLKMRDPSIKHDFTAQDFKPADALNLPNGINPESGVVKQEVNVNPFETIFGEDDFAKLVVMGNPEVHFLMEGLFVCQKASATYIPKTNDYKYESDRKEEEAVLNFCKLNLYLHSSYGHYKDDQRFIGFLEKLTRV
jgi:magnesium-transporting ATPase (P-type)